METNYFPSTWWPMVPFNEVLNSGGGADLGSPGSTLVEVPIRHSPGDDRQTVEYICSEWAIQAEDRDLGDIKDPLVTEAWEQTGLP